MFPAGASTITLTATFPAPVAGTARAGRVVLTPSATLVDSTQKAIYAGGGSVALDADGKLNVLLLCNDDTDVQPTGWRWRVDEQPAGGPRRTYWVDLPSTLGPTVDLSTLAPVSAPGGGSGGGGGGAPTGPAGGALAGTYPNPTLSPATIASFDAAGAASAAQTAAASDATAKVAAHTAASDPHGDRAAATAALDAHTADTSDVHGIADTTVLETQAGAQSKATAAQTAATSAAATDATSKVSIHSAAADPHGDRAWADAKFALASTVTALNSYVDDTVNRIAAVENGAAWLLGLNVDGNAQVVNGDLEVKDTAKGYRFRRGGSALDLEATGADLITSVWSGTGFNGTQRSYDRYSADALNVQHAGRREFVDALYGNVVHAIDTATGVAGLGAVNGLSNTRLAGRRSTSGAPTTGTWSTGDTVQDADGAWWFCATGGTPGTWAGAGTKPWVFDVTAPAYGAKGDAKVVADGAMASGATTLTSATAGFQASDVGKAISVKGAAATGVTTLVTTIAAYVSATQVSLAAANASGGAVSGAIVIYGTDDTTAIQAAVNAAEAYLSTGHTYAQVYIPPRAFVVAGPLSTAKSGNGQIVFGPVATSAGKKILEFRGETDGAAAVRHWQQTVPQTAGSCLISLAVYASTAAQISSINAAGNPGVISGPNEGSGYGVGANYSNMMAVIRNLAIITTHSAYGLTYGAVTLWGVANCHIENLGYGTAGVVPGSDYTSPGTFGTGLSIGLLLPAPGNNDNIVAKNVSCGGGYTYAAFVTEHLMMDRYMALYCWAGLVAVGSYAGSVGSVHALKVIGASIEACTNELYIYGVGSSGVGPIIDIDQLSTENSTPNVSGTSTAAMNSALGKVRLTGLFNEAGVSTSAPTGIELINGQVPAAIKRKTAAFTCSPIDRVLVCDTGSGAFTGTLPAADYSPVEYVFKNIGASDLTVATTSSQLIYTSSGTGATTATVTTGQTLRVRALYNGSSWGWYAL